MTVAGAALLGYMIVLSAAAFTIWTALLGRFPVGRVSLFGFLIPVFGAVFSALVLGENIMTVRNLLSLLGSSAAASRWQISPRLPRKADAHADRTAVFVSIL